MHDASPGRDADDHDVQEASEHKPEEADAQEHSGQPGVRDCHDHQLGMKAGPTPLASLGSSWPRNPKALCAASMLPVSKLPRERGSWPEPGPRGRDTRIPG